ncbi:hypothetical protein HOE04_00900 [archaeon]|jgi:hypothetical protein|nr:hypothetical protein [archaeon]
MTPEQYSPEQMNEITEMILATIDLNGTKKYKRGLGIKYTIPSVEEYKAKVPKEIRDSLEELEIIKLSELERIIRNKKIRDKLKQK